MADKVFPFMLYRHKWPSRALSMQLDYLFLEHNEFIFGKHFRLSLQ